MGNLEGSFLVLKRFGDTKAQWTEWANCISPGERNGVLDKSRAKE